MNNLPIRKIIALLSIMTLVTLVIIYAIKGTDIPTGISGLIVILSAYPSYYFGARTAMDMPGGTIPVDTIKPITIKQNLGGPNG